MEELKKAWLEAYEVFNVARYDGPDMDRAVIEAWAEVLKDLRTRIKAGELTGIKEALNELVEDIMETCA